MSALLAGLMAGAILAVVITIAVVAAGGTFGQRCAKVYSGAAYERCMIRLQAGGPLYQENIGYKP